MQRVDLDKVADTTQVALDPQPDSRGAKWAIGGDGNAIEFGKTTGKPLLSLTCHIYESARPPQITITHSAHSQPGAKALFAVVGSHTVARFKLDATLTDQGWRWEGRYPAAAAALDVFAKPGDIDATLPGGGEFTIEGNGLPRDFIEWCRHNEQGPVEIARAKSNSPG